MHRVTTWGGQQGWVPLIGVSGLFESGLSTSRAKPSTCQVPNEGPLLPSTFTLLCQGAGHTATSFLHMPACHRHLWLLILPASPRSFPQCCIVQTLVPNTHRSNRSFTPSRRLGPGQVTAPSLSFPNCETGSQLFTLKGCHEDQRPRWARHWHGVLGAPCEVGGGSESPFVKRRSRKHSINRTLAGLLFAPTKPSYTSPLGRSVCQ